MLKKPKIFYGWWIVATGFLTIVMSIGIGAYARTVFYGAMLADLGWSRGDLVLSMSVGVLLSAATQPFVGAWVDKHGASRIMALSAFLSGIFLMLSGLIYTLWQAFLIFSLHSLVQFGVTAVPINATISNWFAEKRGMAIGIVTAGMGMGGFLLAPFSAYLIDSIGWRMAWVVLGVLMWVVVIPPALLVMKQKPELMGLLPDGKVAEDIKEVPETEKVKRTPPENDKWTLRGMLGIPAVWLLALVYLLFYPGHLAILRHDYALFVDKGIPVLTAGTLVGMVGLFSFIGKLILGYLADRMSIKYLTALALAVGALATVPLFFVAAEKIWVAWLFVVFWGLFECGVVGLMPTLVASYFNRAIVGRMLGLFAMCSSLGGLLGPTFMGYSFDITGSYSQSLVIFIVLYVISVPLIFLVRPPQETAPSSVVR